MPSKILNKLTAAAVKNAKPEPEKTKRYFERQESKTSDGGMKHKTAPMR